MNKKLNTVNAKQAMDELYLSQTQVAKHLDVSRESVSGWLNGKSFPRPNKLLLLGKLLNLNFNDIVVKEDLLTPKVAFRKKAGTKTKEHHIEKAQNIGRSLKHLAPFLSFNILEMPPVLKSPSCDPEYMNQVILILIV